ncbi:hypothetical protein AURDEDRAFT_163018 [Auricularia subglabra TFB-10046 SS5]|nr:hypothetical protein AURDEDRAFT_163018 [Auricularia subglabra TFB-10046 SS5]
MARQREPKLSKQEARLQAGLAASAPTVIAARAAERSVAGIDSVTQPTAASTSALDDSKQKKQKIPAPPTRTSVRQRNNRERAVLRSGS